MRILSSLASFCLPSRVAVCIGWQWRNFYPYLCQLGFRLHLVGKTLNKSHYDMLYPQNCGRIVAIDSVTLLHLIYRQITWPQVHIPVLLSLPIIRVKHKQIMTIKFINNITTTNNDVKNDVIFKKIICMWIISKFVCKIEILVLLYRNRRLITPSLR